MIITDHTGSRGIEFKKLIISVNKYENCLHHYILEAITRCLNQLSIIVMNKQMENNRRNFTCGDIIDSWIEKGLVEKHVIKICPKTHDDDEFIRNSCNREDREHFVHPFHDDLYLPLIAIEEVQYDISRCMELYKVYSNTKLQ